LQEAPFAILGSSDQLARFKYGECCTCTAAAWNTTAAANVAVFSIRFPCAAYVEPTSLTNFTVDYCVLAESSKYHPLCDGSNTACAVSRVFASVQEGLSVDAHSPANNGFNRAAEAERCGM
jgi:hypothetical protein